MSGATSNTHVFPPIRKVCVFGAGAIGGSFAAKIAAAAATGSLPGVTVGVVARGEHLRAIQAHGLTLDEPQGHVTARVVASGNPTELGPQDVVLLGLKSQQIPDVLPALKPLLAPHTVVLPAINGVPWWYFHADPSPKSQVVATATQGAVLALDPQRQMFAALDPAHVVGCVVHAAAEVVSPGQIKGNGQHKYVIGEPSHQDSARVQALAALMTAAGMTPKTSPRIRDEVWMKLVGNTSYNPVGALTRARMNQINANAGLVELIRQVMTEIQAIARAYDCDPLVSVEERIAIAKGIGPVKVSTLQDLERGRALEVAALMHAPVELGERAGVPMPFTRAMAALLGELNERLLVSPSA